MSKWRSTWPVTRTLGLQVTKRRARHVDVRLRLQDSRPRPRRRREAAGAPGLGGPHVRKQCRSSKPHFQLRLVAVAAHGIRVFCCSDGFVHLAFSACRSCCWVLRCHDFSVGAAFVCKVPTFVVPPRSDTRRHIVQSMHIHPHWSITLCRHFIDEWSKQDLACNYCPSL